MRGLPAGWYILHYHDVSWEESSFIRHIGGTCPPDVFRDQVRTCKGLGALVSVEEGMRRLRAKEIDTPLFSFWFDDGFVGVRKYAAPILEDFGIAGAMSVCSRFVSRKEMFWRLKLSYLHAIDAGRLLRSRLRKYGYTNATYMREFTLDRFGGDVLGVIETLFDEATSDAVRKDAFRIFDTPEGLVELKGRGWTIANHSAAHYPIGEAHVMDIVIDQFEECEGFIRELTGDGCEYWVFPFDRNVDPRTISFVSRHRDNKPVVLVRNRVNLCSKSEGPSVLYRIVAPAISRRQLRDILHAAAV